MAKKKELTREEELAARIQELRGMRGKSRQQIAELNWLEVLQQRDAVQAQMNAGGREIADLRAKVTEAKDRLAVLKGIHNEGLGEVPADQLIQVTMHQREKYTEAAAMAAVVEELERRLLEERSAQRERTKVYNQLTSQAMNLKARTGIPG